MENKKEKEYQKRIEESESSKNPPILLESKSSRPKNTPDVDNRQEQLDKIKKGELGTAPVGYNDDGSDFKATPKKDADTKKGM